MVDLLGVKLFLGVMSCLVFFVSYVCLYTTVAL